MKSLCNPLLVTTTRFTQAESGRAGPGTVFKAVVAVMKTLRLRVVLQLRSGRFSCNPRQANYRAHALNPGLGTWGTGLESCLCLFRGRDLSKSLINLVLGFLTCKCQWPLTLRAPLALMSLWFWAHVWSNSAF